jgi:hypothetical protein
MTGTRTTIESDPGGVGTTRPLATPPRSIVARATTRIRATRLATRRILRTTTQIAAAVGSRRIAEGAGEGGAGEEGDRGGGATEEEAIEAIGTPTGGTDESSRATRFPTSFTAFIIARK